MTWLISLHHSLFELPQVHLDIRRPIADVPARQDSVIDSVCHGIDGVGDLGNVFHQLALSLGQMPNRIQIKLDRLHGIDPFRRVTTQTAARHVLPFYGDVHINVPRDRNGELDPVIVKKHQKSVTGIEDQIIAMYAKGISTWDIQDHLQNLYGVDVSPTMISNVTNKIVPIIKERQNRPLQRVYNLPRPNL